MTRKRAISCTLLPSASCEAKGDEVGQLLGFLQEGFSREITAFYLIDGFRFFVASDEFAPSNDVRQTEETAPEAPDVGTYHGFILKHT